jgi:hypothetical protein
MYGAAIMQRLLGGRDSDSFGLHRCK